MLGIVALTFLVGCIVGAVLTDLVLWRRQNRAGQDLIRAMDAGAIYFGSRSRAAQAEPDQHDQS